MLVFGQAPDHCAAGDEADGSGQNVGNEAAPEEPQDLVEPEGQESEGNGQYDDAKDIEERAAQGLAAACQEEAGVAVDLEEAEAPGNDVKAVAHKIADRRIVGELMCEGVGDESYDDRDDEKVQPGEKVGDFVDLLKPVVGFGAEVLSHHGGKAEAHGHWDHES